MIKRYKDFINESSSAMIKFKGTKDRVKFAIHSFSLRGHDGKVTFLPKTTVELDKLDHMSTEEVYEGLISFANSKFKDIKWIVSPQYEGAGYSLQLDLDAIILKLK